MRILYVYGEEITGKRAREIHTLQRVHSLARAGAEVTLTVATSRSLATTEAVLATAALAPHPRLTIHFFPREWNLGPVHFKDSSRYYRHLNSWMQKQKPFHAAYVIHLKAARYLGRKHPAMPYIFEAHEKFADAHESESTKAKRLVDQEKEVYSKARAVVATSRYLLQTIANSYAIPARSLISPNAVEEAYFSLPANQADPYQLIYIGSFQPWKGVPTAVEAMRYLPEYKLTVVGGSPAEVKSLSQRASANVRFTGHLDRIKLREELIRASIGLLPNRLEPLNALQTFPMKLLEYAAAGKAIAGTHLPVLKELELGSWAKLVEPDQPESLAAAIKSLTPFTRVDEPRQWAGKFRWDTEALRILDFLKSTCLGDSDS